MEESTDNMTNIKILTDSNQSYTNLIYPFSVMLSAG